jgi:BirA family transcriptional regulator, biotin operon repressor / biotin---[acetyl-CoA-carboxylase] ligase
VRAVEAERLAVAASREIDVAAVTALLSAGARSRLAGIEHFATIESTNRYLLEQEPPAAGCMRVALADYQQAGRGRRGRRWNMPAGSGIALSASWRFVAAPREQGALSLATGAAARRAIRDAAGVDVGLKWPNDLIVDGGKVGGILIEISRSAGGACHVVAGIGINVSVPPALLAGLGDSRRGARDLAGALRAVQGGPEIERAGLAAALIERLVELFSGFAGSGFAPYREEWLAAHVLADRRVEIDQPGGIVVGTVCGIDADGALIVMDTAGARQRIVAGDASVRESI